MTSIWSQNPCAAAGAIAGGFAGLMTALLQIMHGTVPALTPSSTFWRAVILLTLVAVLIVLFLMGVLLRYGIGNIVLQSIVTCFFSVLLTVWLLEKINVPVIAVPLGIVIGTIVGWILCYLFCGRDKLVEAQHG